jgi:hypothetical protein
MTYTHLVKENTSAMLSGQKIVVVMPAYNAARTLHQTYNEVMAHGIVESCDCGG